MLTSQQEVREVTNKRMDETLSLEKFDPTVADLQQLVGITSQVVVSDINDKDQLEAVKTNRIALRDARVAISKKGKELREGAIKFQKDVIAKEKELIAIIEPEENRLKAIEEEVKVKKIRAERMAVLPQRKERLNSIGDGVDYSDKDDLLLGMDDAEFDAYYNQQVANKNEADAAALKAREDAAAAEEKRLADEKAAREREEIARKEGAEKAEREAKEKAEREAQEEVERKLSARIAKCTALGLRWLPDQSSYVLDDINVAIVEIKTLSDEDWGALVTKIYNEIERRKEAAEQKRQEERKEAERIALEKEEKYQAFLKEHGWSQEQAEEFYIDRSDSTKVVLYKKVGVFVK